MRYFARFDPARRMRRFYIIGVEQDLFGRHDLWLEWGRAGQPGTLRRFTFDQPHDAEKAAARVVRRRLRRGYEEKPLRSSVVHRSPVASSA
jgi:predicted DNA-binding WGR domain protein